MDLRERRKPILTKCRGIERETGRRILRVFYPRVA